VHAATVLQSTEIVGCTIVSRNYLAQARAAAESFLLHHPGCRFVVLLVDRNEGSIDPSGEAFELLEYKDLPLPHSEWMAFRYTVIELNTAVKPFFLRHLLRTTSARAVIYIDPDTLFFSQASLLLELLEEHPLVLTPHITSPINDDQKPTELDILLAGVHNLGFGAFRRSPDIDALLEWWSNRLKMHCLNRPQEGLFVDQRWMDFAPAFVEGTCLLRDPGYNMAYWNLHERTLRKEGNMYSVNDRPLVFFHFSGYLPDQPCELSRHQTRTLIARHRALQELHDHYSDLLRAHGYEAARTLPYAFASFAGGIPVPQVARRLHLSLGEKADRYGDPFQTGGERSFFSWLQSADARSADPRITNLLAAARTYGGEFAWIPDDADDNAAFITWLLFEHGAQHLGIHRDFLQHLRATSVPAVSLPRALRLFLRHRHSWKPYQRFCRFMKRKIGERPFQDLKQMLFGWERRPLISQSKRQPMVVTGLNIVGYLDAAKGVSEVCRSMIQAAETVRIPYTRTSVDHRNPPLSAESRLTPFPPPACHNVNLVHVNADELPFVAAELGPSFFAERKTIGYWCWELPDFPKQLHQAFDLVNEIWTLSSFSQQSIAEVSPVPVITMWPSLDTTIHGKANRARFGIPDDRFVVLFIFDPSSFIERKNPYGLIEAFRQAFPKSDKATLVISMPGGRDAVPEKELRLRRALDAVGGLILTERLERADVWNLMASADCYASLHRSEGFGLTIAEAMLLGVPVMATDYGGNTDFMSPHDTWRIGYQLRELERSYGPYHQGSFWADPDTAHAAWALRHIAEDLPAARAKAARAKLSVAAQLSPEAVGLRMKKRLAHLQW